MCLNLNKLMILIIQTKILLDYHKDWISKMMKIIKIKIQLKKIINNLKVIIINKKYLSHIIDLVIKMKMKELLWTGLVMDNIMKKIIYVPIKF